MLKIDCKEFGSDIVARLEQRPALKAFTEKCSAPSWILINVNTVFFLNKYGKGLMHDFSVGWRFPREIEYGIEYDTYGEPLEYGIVGKPLGFDFLIIDIIATLMDGRSRVNAMDLAKSIITRSGKAPDIKWVKDYAEPTVIVFSEGTFEDYLRSVFL